VLTRPSLGVDAMVTVDGVRFLLSRRWITFLLLVIALAYGCFRLGEWQFHRLQDREHRNAITVRNMSQRPLPVQEVMRVGKPVSEQDEWRHVTAKGHYADNQTIVVRYQTRDGDSGVDVVTPLVTDQGPALLVNRGWLATGNVGTTQPDVPPVPSGEVTVTGWVRADATGDSTQVADRSTRAISSVAIGHTLPMRLYSGWVEADKQVPADSPKLENPEQPDLGNGPHLFYGIQWWFFAGLAVFGFLYLVWDERKKHRAAGTAPSVPPADRRPPVEEKTPTP
jgi:cytochrome oxidase assembly protein ShyY1